MRAGRFRVWRIRSPSSRNELIETDIRQKARQCRAFLFPAFFIPTPFTSKPLFVWRHIALQMALLCRWRDAEFRAVRIFTDAILPCGRMMPMTACGDMAVGC
jgi:hypothetical protein